MEVYSPHLIPESSCVNCLDSYFILYLWHTFLMGHTATFDLQDLVMHIIRSGKL